MQNHDDFVTTAVQPSASGYLDKIERDRISGWAQDPAQPDVPVDLEIWIDEQFVARVVANLYRSDLEKAGLGDGRRSFRFRLAAPLSPQRRHMVAVRRVADGVHLHGSPGVLEAEIDPLFQHRVDPLFRPEIDPLFQPEIVEPPTVAPPPTAVPVAATPGKVDLVRRDRIAGWAHDPLRPGSPVSLLVTVNGQLLERVLSNGYRADLEKAGLGDGRKSFQLQVIPALSPLVRQVIEVRREDDGLHLPGSPHVLEPEAEFSADAQDWMTRLLANTHTDAGLEERFRYLSAQLELLSQQHADRQAHRHEREAERQTRHHRGKQAPGVDGTVPGTTRETLRALVIDDRLPASDRDAGSNAILSHIASLQRLGYEVSFTPAQMDPDRDAGRMAGIDCCGPPWYASVEEVLRRQAHCFDLVYLHRLSIADRYTALVRQHQPKAKLVYSIADLHYLRVDRQARVEQRPELVTLAKRMQVAELLAISRADQVITHSQHEAELLQRQVPKAKVHVVPWSIPVRPTAAPFAQRRGMAFIGGYAHTPNVDAARWLIDEIVPLLRARDPDFECLLVGSEMPASLMAPRPGIVPIGQVENLADIFDRVRVTAAPLSFGAGIKGKVLDSLAAGVPCVCTTIAAEGLDLPQALLSQVADDASAIAAMILRLHEDAQLNQAVGEAGLEYVRQRLSEPQIDRRMRNVVGLPAAGSSQAEVQ